MDFLGHKVSKHLIACGSIDCTTNWWPAGVESVSRLIGCLFVGQYSQ